MKTFNDRREQILERLEVILSGLTIPISGGSPPSSITSIPAGNFARNRNELDAAKVPGILLLDGDEVRDPRVSPRPPRGMTERAVPDSIMKMTPEIYVVLDVRGITNPNVGQDLNSARLAVLAAVLPDKQLQDIVGGNGDIVYDGCITDLSRNRPMRGQLGMSISFSYPLRAPEYRGV